MVTAGIQQTLLEHAAVCSHLLESTSSPDELMMVGHLRELWKTLADEAWRFSEAELAEEVETLCSVQAVIATKMKPTLH
jgi:hypothetical protein